MDERIDWGIRLREEKRREEMNVIETEKKPIITTFLTKTIINTCQLYFFFFCFLSVSSPFLILSYLFSFK